MDRRRTGSPVYGRQWSGGSSSTGSSSPAMSPAHPQSRLGPSSTGLSTVKRTQNVAAKAAAQRLARVMASQTSAADDDGEDDDDLEFRFAAPPAPSLSSFSSNASSLKSTAAGGAAAAATTIPPISVARPNRSPSPALGRNFVEHTHSVRSTSAGRPAVSVRSTPAVPPSKSTIRTPMAVPPIDPPSNRNREKKLPIFTEELYMEVEYIGSGLDIFNIYLYRFTPDITVKPLNSKDTGDQREASALRDELDMLQEENEIILEKAVYTRYHCQAT